MCRSCAAGSGYAVWCGRDGSIGWRTTARPSRPLPAWAASSTRSSSSGRDGRLGFRSSPRPVSCPGQTLSPVTGWSTTAISRSGRATRIPSLGGATCSPPAPTMLLAASPVACPPPCAVRGGRCVSAWRGLRQRDTRQSCATRPRLRVASVRRASGCAPRCGGSVPGGPLRHLSSSRPTPRRDRAAVGCWFRHPTLVEGKHQEQ